MSGIIQILLPEEHLKSVTYEQVLKKPQQKRLQIHAAPELPPDT